MSWLIILAVVAVALAPLLHFAPSKRQRRIARLREHAALAGLFVEFRKLPEAAQGRVEAGGDTIYYGRRLAPPKHGHSRGGCWLLREGEWRPVGDRQPVPEALAGLPASVLVAGLDSGSCGVYWREDGVEEDIDRIDAVLGAWAELL